MSHRISGFQLAHYENIIKEKRKKTPFREFVKEVASWCPISFYKYKDGMIGKFPREKIRVCNIVTSRTFHESRDELLKYGVSYESGLFPSISELFRTVPVEALKQFDGTINTEYADIALGRNIYLTVVGFESENVAYSFNVKNNGWNIYNSVLVWENCENVYFGKYVTNSSNIFYSQYIHSSHGVWLSSDLIGCQDCIACSGLRNMRYCINNTLYTKEEYEQKKHEYLGNKARLLIIYQQIIDRASQPEITNYLCEDVQNGIMNYRVKTGRNIIFVGAEDPAERMYDVVSAGILPIADFYGVMGAGLGSEHLYCSVEIVQSSHIFYSYLLEDCSFCIGCIGLKNKSYCILNKQYTKEEWEVRADQIFASMEQDGTLGDFFPPSMNPFYFNDTLAYLIDNSYTQEEISREGYLWRDEAIKVDIPENAEVIQSSRLDGFQGFDASGKWQINRDILKKVIVDQNGNYYKIIPMEYDFLTKHSLPLPTMHWLDRIKMGFQM